MPRHPSKIRSATIHPEADTAVQYSASSAVVCHALDYPPPHLFPVKYNFSNNTFRTRCRALRNAAAPRDKGRPCLRRLDS